MRVHRLISILLLIESRGSIKAKELASKLEISIRTVYRDIDTLCEAGIPITTTSGPKGGIRLMDGWTGWGSLLREDEIINLYLSGMGLIPDKNSDMSLKLNNALLKLEKNLPQSQKFELNNIKKRFYFDEDPWWGDNQSKDNIDAIVHSVFSSKVLGITYKKVKGEVSKRRVYPYGIVVKGKVDWYLVAYCEKSKDSRTFKCERIIECDILSETFKIPVDFSIEQYWNGARGGFKSLCEEREKYPVDIRVDKNQSNILSNFEVYEVKDHEDYILATINMYDYEYATHNIMKLIASVEVIGPSELKSFIKEELENIILKYRDS